MTRLLKLGIVFSYRENWAGGNYYLLNLISALKQLEQKGRPALTVFASAPDRLDVVKSLGYPNASYRLLQEPEPGRLLSLTNRVAGKLLRRPLILPPAIGEEVDVIYPASHDPRFRETPNRLFWIPDFQEEYLPEMFTLEQLENRRRVRGRIARSAENIVFSSEDAARDFTRFYPQSQAIRHVLNFAVTHPDYQDLDIESLRRKYKLADLPFFLVSNQFWKHKNHRIVIEALKLIKARGDKDRFLLCFSGKEEDARNPGYAGEMKALVNQYDLQDSVRFLGFIERAHQIRLMAESEAVIQPSLFEGWSTVVEDAKALSVPVIASDLPVHQEQLGERGTYFLRNDHEELARKMDMYLTGEAQSVELTKPYSENVRIFGEQFVRILRIVVGLEQRAKNSSGSESLQYSAK